MKQQQKLQQKQQGDKPGKDEDEEDWQQPVAPLFGGTCWNQSYYHSACGTITIRTKNSNSNPLLFADDIWPGSLFVADYLADHSEDYILHKEILELGAGGALPSLVCAKLGYHRLVISDYPDADILKNINELLIENDLLIKGNESEENNEEEKEKDGRKISVMGHVWGQSVENLMQKVDTNSSHSLKCDSNNNNNNNNNDNNIKNSNINSNTINTVIANNGGGNFDTIILAELLWKDTYSQHKALLTSVTQCLSPITGRALVCFAHRPVRPQEREGKGGGGGGGGGGGDGGHSIARDMEFFTMAKEEFHMSVKLLRQKEFEDPFSGANGLVMVYLYELSLGGGMDGLGLCDGYASINQGEDNTTTACRM